MSRLSACLGALLGLLPSCSSSPSTGTNTRSSDPPAGTACASCSATLAPPGSSPACASCSSPAASTSAPATASAPPTTSAPPTATVLPACSAWMLPTAVSSNWNHCQHQPDRDAACSQVCANRPQAWTCPDGQAHDVTCFAQGDHWCCPNVKCGLDTDPDTAHCDPQGTYFCNTVEGEPRPVQMPADMGCTLLKPNDSINCCPFKVP